MQVLAAVADNGTCSLWAWEKRLQITLLDLPKGQTTLQCHATASHLLEETLQQCPPLQIVAMLCI